MRHGRFNRAMWPRRMVWPAHSARPHRRWALVALLTTLVIIQVVLIGGRTPRLILASASAPSAPRAYGADDARMQAAVNAAGWPQQHYNWCGVATVAAIADYRGGGVSQGNVSNWMSSGGAISQWGTPSVIYSWTGFPANIARDTGTDPRALAAGLAAMAGGRYHALADPWGSWDATYRLAVDLEYSGQPISVIVDHGLHSVVVSRVYANGDPASNPGSIYALEVWDPGYGTGFQAEIQNAQRVVVPLGDWLYDEVYWGWSYDSNGGMDPDPAVGPYTYDPSQGDYNHTWIGNWVYIQPWGPNVSVDWTVNALDWVVPGQHGELPPGYALPTPTPLPGRDGRAAPIARVPIATPTSTRRTAAAPPIASGASPTPYGGPPPETISQPFVAPTSGVTWCLGPYCLAEIDPLWLATSGGLIGLALLLLASAFWIPRLAGRRVAAGGPNPGSNPGRKARKRRVRAPAASAVPLAMAAVDVPAPRVVPVCEPVASAATPAEPREAPASEPVPALVAAGAGASASEPVAAGAVPGDPTA